MANKEAEQQWEILKANIPGYTKAKVEAENKRMFKREKQLIREDNLHIDKILKLLEGDGIDEEFPAAGWSTVTSRKPWTRERIPHQPFQRARRQTLAEIAAQPDEAKSQTEKSTDPPRQFWKSPCWAFGGSVAPFTEKRPQSVRNLLPSGEWEYLESIVDSGATVTVIPPSVGRDYAILAGEASKAGVMYEVANGEEIPNLGEKLMPVLTAEGSRRGLRAQVADVSKPLQAVRALVKTGHAVVFGGGENGDENYVVNKLTGEVNWLRDDGLNYLMGMWIIPKAEAGFGWQAAHP